MAYREAGRPDRATRMLEQLTHNAVLQNNFADGAHYFFLLAIEVCCCSSLPGARLAFMGDTIVGSLTAPIHLPMHDRLCRR